MLVIRRTSELKFPDEYTTPFDTRLIDNKIWLRDELKKLRGKAARRRDRAISNTLKQVHKPYHSRSTEDTIQHDGTILFDLT